MDNSTLTLEFKRRNDVASQTLPIRETSPQVSWSDAEPFLESQTRNTPVQCHNDSMERQPENHWNETNMTANDNGDDNNSPPIITTS